MRLESEASLDRTLSALADPTRRAIVARLMRGEARVTDVAAPFALSLPAVSKHLRRLEAAGLLTRLMTRLLFGTSPLDPLSFTLGPALLIGVGIVASLLPAMRAASTDPAKVLRGE